MRDNAAGATVTHQVDHGGLAGHAVPTAAANRCRPEEAASHCLFEAQCHVFVRYREKERFALSYI
eukprot:5543095-Prymnesium_polylepis.1